MSETFTEIYKRFEETYKDKLSPIRGVLNEALDRHDIDELCAIAKWCQDMLGMIGKSFEDHGDITVIVNDGNWN